MSPVDKNPQNFNHILLSWLFKDQSYTSFIWAESWEEKHSSPHRFLPPMTCTLSVFLYQKDEEPRAHISGEIKLTVHERWVSDTKCKVMKEMFEFCSQKKYAHQLYWRLPVNYFSLCGFSIQGEFNTRSKGLSAPQRWLEYNGPLNGIILWLGCFRWDKEWRYYLWCSLKWIWNILLGIFFTTVFSVRIFK